MTNDTPQPRSQEAFKFLGVLDDFLEVAGPGYGNMRLYDPEGNVVKDTVFREKSEATPEIPLVSFRSAHPFEYED